MRTMEDIVRLMYAEERDAENARAARLHMLAENSKGRCTAD